MTTYRPPFSPNEFKALIIEEDDTLCQALRNLTKLTVMWWKMVRFKYKPDGTGFTRDYAEMLQDALADCPDDDAEFEGETPNPQDFKNFLVSPNSIFCEKFVKFAVGLSNKLYELVAFEYNATGDDFSDEFKALLCGVDCGQPPDDIDIISLLNYRNFLRWDVVSGEVDLIGISPWDPVANGVGMYVDLSGTKERPKINSTVWDGGIRTKSTYSFPIVAGKSYRITYKLAGHNIGLSNSGNVRVRVLKADLTQYESVDDSKAPSAWNMPFTTQTINFTAGSDESQALLQIENTQRHSSEQNIGPKIDEISVFNLTDGTTIFYEDFEDEFLARGDDATIQIDLPDPDDSKDAIPLLAMEVCEKLAKIVIDFPRNVYDVVSWEYNSAGNGLGSQLKLIICNPRAVIDPEEPEEDNGLLVGLQAYWKHDEASGDVLDAHAGHDLTETDGVLSSVSPGALELARGYPIGATSRAANGAWNDLSATDWTFVGWIEMTAVGTGDRVYVMSKGDVSTGGYGVFYEDDAVTPQLAALIDTFGWYQVLTEAPDVGSWMFVSVRFTAATQMVQIDYGVNGTLVLSTGTSALVSPPVSTDEFMLGGAIDTGVVDHTLGGRSLDESALWHRALSDSDIETIFNGGTPLSYDEYTA